MTVPIYYFIPVTFILKFYSCPLEFLERKIYIYKFLIFNFGLEPKVNNFHTLLIADFSSFLNNKKITISQQLVFRAFTNNIDGPTKFSLPLSYLTNLFSEQKVENKVKQTNEDESTKIIPTTPP